MMKIKLTFINPDGFTYEPAVLMLNVLEAE